MRLVVVDTNIVVSGLISSEPSSSTCLLPDAMLEGTLAYLLSDELLAEYRCVLMRPKLQAQHKLDEAEVDTFLTEIVANAIWRVNPQVTPTQKPRDLNDSHLWALLMTDSSAILVTGDKLLLSHPPEGREVVSPIEFLSRSPL